MRRRRRASLVGRRACALILGGCVLAGCNAKLPEPESEGAKLYAARCNGCHRIYAPSLLKFEMWKLKIDAMQGEMARRGVSPLNEQEKAVVLDYLRRHGG